MKIGHSFHPQHGFTGSASESPMHPTIPGFKRGGHAVEHGAHHDLHDDHPKHEGHKHEDEHGFEVHHMKKGGKAHKGHKKHKE